MRTCVRMTCCCLTLAIIIVLSIILTIALVSISSRIPAVKAEGQYVRPPNVTLNNIEVGNDAVSLTGTGLSIAFGVSLRQVTPLYALCQLEADG